MSLTKLWFMHEWGWITDEQYREMVKKRMEQMGVNNV